MTAGNIPDTSRQEVMTKPLSNDTLVSNGDTPSDGWYLWMGKSRVMIYEVLTYLDDPGCYMMLLEFMALRSWSRTSEYDMMCIFYMQDMAQAVHLRFPANP